MSKQIQIITDPSVDVPTSVSKEDIVLLVGKHNFQANNECVSWYFNTEKTQIINDNSV